MSNTNTKFNVRSRQYIQLPETANGPVGQYAQAPKRQSAFAQGFGGQVRQYAYVPKHPNANTCRNLMYEVDNIFNYPKQLTRQRANAPTR